MHNNMTLMYFSTKLQIAKIHENAKTSVQYYTPQNKFCTTCTMLIFPKNFQTSRKITSVYWYISLVMTADWNSDKQKRSTEGCSKFKSPETRQRQKGGDLTQSYDKSPYTHGNVKRAVTTQTTPQKSSIKQRLRTDLGRSVGVTTVTQLVWLTGLRAHQVQERLVSTLEHMQVPKWDRTRCPEE